MVFAKRIIGFDRLQVNMCIYDLETEFLTRLEELENEMDQVNDKIKRKSEKIEELQQKIEMLSESSGDIEGIEPIIEQISNKFINDSEVNAGNIADFYEKENEKLKSTISKLDSEIEEAKNALKNALSSVYASVNNTFYDEIPVSASTDNEQVEPLCKDSIIGKTVSEDIKDEEGNIIAKCGDEVNEELLHIVRKSNKIMELLSNI